MCEETALDAGPEDVFESMGLRHVVESANEERVPLGSDESLPGAHIVIQQTAGLNPKTLRP